MQLQNWLVCQKCGRVAPRGTIDWLDQEYLHNPSLRVVRCPIHWTEWSLRQCVGRSTWHREEMHRLKIKYARWTDEAPPQVFPLKDEECHPSAGNAEFRSDVSVAVSADTPTQPPQQQQQGR